MKRVLMAWGLVLAGAMAARAQTTEVKFIADTVVVQAEGSYEADPDLATLAFDISTQDKDMKKAYDTATQSMQRIAALAEKSGLKKADVSTGVLTLAPSYERDRKNKAKSYSVRGFVTLNVRDFSQIGPLLDGAVEEGIVDFRSLTYSLQDEEAAKERAVAQAMQRAVGRASAALAQNGQKAGAVRYASLDVRQLMGVTRLESSYGATNQVVEVTAGGMGASHAKAPVPTYPFIQPQKITVSASVQCAFEIK